MPAKPQPDDPYGLAAARKIKGLTTEALIAATYDLDGGPLSKSTYTLVVRGDREPTDATLVTFGEAMQAEPGEWPEYDLARARSLLNPRFVGRVEALTNYEKVRDALGLPREHASTATRLAIETAAKEAARPRGKRTASRGTRRAADAKDASS